LIAVQPENYRLDGKKDIVVPVWNHASLSVFYRLHPGLKQGVEKRHERGQDKAKFGEKA
jgi:hypothetical protein